MKPLKKNLQRVIIFPDGETYEFFVDCFYADLTEKQVERLRDGLGIDTLIDEGLRLRVVGDDLPDPEEDDEEDDEDLEDEDEEDDEDEDSEVGDVEGELNF